MKIATIALCALTLGALAGCGHENPPTIKVGASAPSPPPSGLVQGRLLAVGGPAPGKPRPLAGTISFKGPGGSTATTQVDADGKFTIELSPGSYVITGTSPSYESNKGVCSTEKPSTAITASGSATADVLCQEP